MHFADKSASHIYFPVIFLQTNRTENSGEVASAHRMIGKLGAEATLYTMSAILLADIPGAQSTTGTRGSLESNRENGTPTATAIAITSVGAQAASTQDTSLTITRRPTFRPGEDKWTREQQYVWTEKLKLITHLTLCIDITTAKHPLLHLHMFKKKTHYRFHLTYRPGKEVVVVKAWAALVGELSSCLNL